MTAIRVLLVEDNPTDAMVVRDELAHALGSVFVVEQVGRLTQAQAKLAADTFDVVLLDLSLPDSEGLGTFTRLSAAAPRVPVVVVSHRHDEQLALQAVQAGAQDYLVKGQAEGLLVRAIRHAIERKITEQTLQETRERYRSLIESAPFGILVQRNGRFIFANPAAVGILGASRASELIGTSVMERIHPGSIPAAQQRMQDIMEAGAVPDTDVLRFLRLDGTVIDVELQCRPVVYEGENAIQSSLVDVTSRTRLDEALRFLAASSGAYEQEGFFRPLARYLAQVLGADYVCISQNAADDEEDAGLAVFLDGKFDDRLAYRLPAEAQPGVAEGAVSLFVSDVCQRFPDDMALKALRAQSYLSIALRSATGEPIGLIAVISRRPVSNPALAESILSLVAVRAAAEVERLHSQRRLNLAASVFTNTREGILITDAAGAIVEVNDAFTHITGYSRDDAVGQNPRFLQSGRHAADFYEVMWQDLAAKGFWSGEVWNRRKNGEVFAEMQSISVVRDAAGVTQNYVGLFTDITPLKEHQRQLEHIAHYDALTSLPNRVLLADRLQQAMAHSQRRGQSLAVAFLDLDGFKAVNDTHGHDVGDDLLVALAQRMKDALREGDSLARLGGDEFVAVLVDLEHAPDCEPVLARILKAASDPVKVGDVVLQVSASVGVTVYPQDAADAEQLMRHADQAMYLAKQAGKNRYHLFDVAQDEAVKTQRESLDRIRSALQAREFVLYYQPKVNMRTGRVMGAEALIRWLHPERGLLPPATFLPLIENHPVTVEIGEWVIDAALTQLEAWQAGGLDMVVSVNIGARQLQQGCFATRLAQLLANHPGVSPERLELEILETSAMEDIATVSEIMRACRALGVRFALDDFGTGYSSLTYLKHLPAELIKIDQSFVRDMLADPDDLAIVTGVIGLAKAFRREVIAEGVETIPHGEMLLGLGCELAQGYGIARPMPGADLPRWAATWQPDAAWLRSGGAVIPPVPALP